MSQPKKPPARPTARASSPTATMAKPLALLLTVPKIERGETEQVNSFRSSTEIADWIKESAIELGVDETAIKNRFMATLREIIDEAKPRAALFSVYAEARGLEPGRAIVQLALRCLAVDHPELFAKFGESKPPKK
jgi:hypothetical protein